jgi:hypothetical protein
MRASIRFLCLLGFCLTGTSPLFAADHVLHSFDVQQLTDVYYSEGANAADINRDGKTDLIHGPHWYVGPDFKERHEFYPAKPQPRNRYADNFFTWPHDFNGDGWIDLLVVGLPGTPAYLYENPTSKGFGKPWTKHEVFDSVGNESPQLTNLVGDERPELVCTYKGMFGYVEVNWKNPFKTWNFVPISGRITAMRFGHGLGIGDINGDGRLDVTSAGGWIEQPGANDPKALWKAHQTKFSNSYGGAEMYVYDVDGDGDNDVITSMAAHDFGLAWYEQKFQDGQRTFAEHIIMGARKDQNRYGVVFSELHSVALADMDGDGLKDIVTGKTYYSHHEKSPQWNAGAVVYWFRLVRSKTGVDWVPYQAAADTGIGRQITVADVNGDKLPDIVVGGMKGGNVLIQQRHSVSPTEWAAMQPQRQTGSVVRLDRSTAARFGKTGRVSGAIEGESMKVLRVSTGKVGPQDMTRFRKGKWSGGSQLFWSSAKPRARLDLEFEISKAGNFDIEAHFTTARDYAIINVLLDSKALGEPIDLFDHPDVSTTGVLKLDQRELKAGKHKLTLETIGANESAVKKYMVGLDYLRLVPR